MLTSNAVCVCEKTHDMENFNKDKLIFIPLTIDDESILEKYLSAHKFTTSEYTFANLLIWRNGCKIEYSIYNDTLIIRKKDFKGNYHFMQPVGYKKDKLKILVEKLKEYKDIFDMPYLFKDVEESFLNDLREVYGDNLIIEEDTDNFDYIYSSDKLISLSGKKLHSKKNHYNYFIKNYEYIVKDLNDAMVREDCINAAKLWHTEKYNGDTYLDAELGGIQEILNYMDKLNLKGLAVYVNNTVAAFTIGERTNENMAIIYIEKGRLDINGIYAFINKTFVEKYFSDIEYINREQDLGIEGLKKAKKSYYPVKLEKKYCVNF